MSRRMRRRARERTPTACRTGRPVAQRSSDRPRSSAGRPNGALAKLELNEAPPPGGVSFACGVWKARLLRSWLMKPRVMYVELKTGFNDDGPAWIGWVRFLKTGRTVYFHDRTLARRQGISGNHYDVETGEE